MLKRKDTKLIIENWRKFLNEEKNGLTDDSIVQFVVTSEGVDSLKKLGIDLEDHKIRIPIFQMPDAPIVANCLALVKGTKAYVGCWLDGKGISNRGNNFIGVRDEINKFFNHKGKIEWNGARKTKSYTFYHIIDLFETDGMQSFQEYPGLKGVYFINKNYKTVTGVAYNGGGQEGIKNKLNDITVF